MFVKPFVLKEIVDYNPHSVSSEKNQRKVTNQLLPFVKMDVKHKLVSMVPQEVLFALKLKLNQLVIDSPNSVNGRNVDDHRDNIFFISMLMIYYFFFKEIFFIFVT